MFFDDPPNSGDHAAGPRRRDNRRHIVGNSHHTSIVHPNKRLRRLHQRPKRIHLAKILVAHGSVGPGVEPTSSSPEWAKAT